MSRNPRIVVRSAPRIKLREYHVNSRISNTVYRETQGRPDSEEARVLMGREPLSESEEWFVSDLHAIDGVTEVCFDTYQLRIRIAVAFDWEDVQPEIIERISKYLCWTKDPEIIEDAENIDYSYDAEVY